MPATDRGHQEIQSVYFQGTTVPTNFLVALVNDTIVGTDDWADISGNEISGTGYAQETINRDATASGWPTGPVLDSSEMMITSKKATFTATSTDWTAANNFVLIANMVTDRLLCYVPISAITVANGASVSITFKVKFTK